MILGDQKQFLLIDMEFDEFLIALITGILFNSIYLFGIPCQGFYYFRLFIENICCIDLLSAALSGKWQEWWKMARNEKVHTFESDF